MTFTGPIPAMCPRCGHLAHDPRATLRCIMADLAREHGLSVADLRGPSRWRSLAWPRQEFMWRAHKRGFSLLKIGAFLGKDHTTILHGCREHARRVELLAGP